MKINSIHILLFACLLASTTACKDDEQDPEVDCIKTTWYQDMDQDGFGNSQDSTLACTMPEGYVANGEDTDDSNADINPNTIWSGPKMTFTKGNNTDPTLEANQDRITDNVWITRGTMGGGLYNVKSETEYADFFSPSGTQWSLGTAANLSSLTFTDWETAVGDGPPSVVDKDMVLYLVVEKKYIDIKITNWAKGNGSGSGAGGAFTYIRSTETP